MKIFIKILIIILSVVFAIIFFLINNKNNNVQATGGSSGTSDVQLLARAINGEARGESYEGQVAVRCSYIK